MEGNNTGSTQTPNPSRLGPILDELAKAKQHHKFAQQVVAELEAQPDLVRARNEAKRLKELYESAKTEARTLISQLYLSDIDPAEVDPRASVRVQNDFELSDVMEFIGWAIEHLPDAFRLTLKKPVISKLLKHRTPDNYPPGLKIVYKQTPIARAVELRQD